MKSTFDAADEESVFQPCIFLEDDVVMMHVVCRTTVLDPDSIDLSYRDVSRCLIAVCEATEYGTECLAVIVVARFSIVDTTKCTSSTTTATATTTAPSPIAFGFLVLISMFRVIFLRNAFVAL